MKVSFDFDSTLDKEEVQKYAKELLDRGIEVHIVTSRIHETDSSLKLVTPHWNDDMYAVCEKIGIPKENIHFTKYEDKFKFFSKNPDFVWHLDDDEVEIHLICKLTQVHGILVYSSYIEECNEWINKTK